MEKNPRKYVLLKNWHKGNNKYNWETGCEFCKKPFSEEEKFTRVDVQNGWMRGDDDVYSFHNDCAEAGLKAVL